MSVTEHSTVLLRAEAPALVDGELATPRHVVLSSLRALQARLPAQREQLVAVAAPPLEPYQRTRQDEPTPRQKRRKLERRRETQSSTDADEREYHESVKPWLLSALQSLQSHDRFDELVRLDAALQTATSTTSTLSGLDWTKLSSRASDDISRDLSSFETIRDTAGSVWHNDREEHVQVELEHGGDGQRVQLDIPPQGAWLASDFGAACGHASTLRDMAPDGWDIVLLDPPWPNKSARRSESYAEFDAYDLFKLDMPLLLRGPALVCIWVTNKPKFRRLVTDKLFPKWDISREIAEIYWCKLTASGELVMDLEGDGRRPYEALVIGRYDPNDELKPLAPSQRLSAALAFPLGHSRKPYLIELLLPLLERRDGPLKRAANVAEFFARTVCAGIAGPAPEQKRGMWLSLGNEPLKFNTIAVEAAIER